MGEPEILTNLDEARNLATEWRALSRDVGSGYFDTPDWCLSWWQTYGGALRVVAAVWRSSNGTLEAIACLGADPIPLKHGRRWTVDTWSNLCSVGMVGDRRTIVALPHRASDVRRFLGDFGRRPIVLHDLDPAAAQSFVPAGAKLISRRVSPILRLCTDDMDPLPVSRAFPKKFAYYARHLAKAGVEIRRVPPGAIDEELLESLFRLHAKRRTELGKQASSIFIPELGPFLRLLARAGDSSHGPVAVVAEHNGAAIGVLLGLWWAGTFSFYQHGWEPDWAPKSLGTVLITEAIAYAQDLGARDFDFMWGQGSYKYRFGAVDHTDETWLLPRGAGGRLLEAKFVVHGLRERWRRPREGTPP